TRVGIFAHDEAVVAGSWCWCACLVGERAAALIDADFVGASAGVDRNRGERGAIEAELGGSVVADVELEDVRCPGLQPQRELVARAVTVDLERSGSYVRAVGRMCG